MRLVVHIGSFVAAGCCAAGSFAQATLHEFHGPESHDFLGIAVGAVGDLDGDGFDDVLAGALGYEAGARAEVHSGRTGALIRSFPIQSLSSCAGAGDVDGDGVPDVIVGNGSAASLGNGTGEAVVFSGATGVVLHTFTGGAAHDQLGSSVGGARDLDADGFDDLLVGAPQIASPNSGPGYVRAFSGRTGALLHQFVGGADGDAFGAAVSMVRDLDFDGRAEVLVGAPNESGSGGAHLFSGPSGAPLLHLQGAAAGERFGHALGDAGDVDGDGLADLVVGSPSDDTGAVLAGKVQVFTGSNGARIHTFLGGEVAALLGTSVAGAGDVDGDGRADVIAGGPGAGGSATVFSGADGSAIFGLSGGANLGHAVGSAGDVDGDCLADVIAADPVFSAGLPERGKVLVLSGRLAGASAYCFGDGAGSACPCGNPSAPSAGQGCANSTGRGARVTALGSASAAADDLLLHGCGLSPLQPALAFSGVNATNGGNGLVFGDGLRCAGGSVKRLGIDVADGLGTARFGPGLVAAGGFEPGDLRRFQLWHRDPANGPCGSGFNLSNGVELGFAP